MGDSAREMARAIDVGAPHLAEHGDY